MSGGKFSVIELLFSVRRRERAQHKREPETYWVTDLVRCPLKREFEEKYPELVEQHVFHPVFILGDLVHAGLERLLQEELAQHGASVEVEVEGVKKVKLPGKGLVRIKGRMDVLVELGDKRIGIEIKTARGDAGLPLQQHVDQVKLYNWLFDLSSSVLVYVTPERVTEYTVADAFDESDVAEMVLSSESPRYAWECGYCSFAVLCPNKVKRS